MIATSDREDRRPRTAAAASATAPGRSSTTPDPACGVLMPMSPCTKLREPLPPLHDDRLIEAERGAAAAGSAVASSGAWRNFASGSTASRTSQNVMNDATRSTGIEPSMRRTRYLSTRVDLPRSSDVITVASAMRRTLLLDTPLIDVPEHAFDRVVRIGPTTLSLQMRMSGSGSSGSATACRRRGCRRPSSRRPRRTLSSRLLSTCSSILVGRRGAGTQLVLFPVYWLAGVGMFCGCRAIEHRPGMSPVTPMRRRAPFRTLPCTHDLAEQVVGAGVLDRHVEAGGLELGLDDLFGELTPLVAGGRGDGERGRACRPWPRCRRSPSSSRRSVINEFTLVEIDVVAGERVLIAVVLEDVRVERIRRRRDTERAEQLLHDRVPIDGVPDRLTDGHRVEREGVVVRPQRLDGGRL